MPVFVELEASPARARARADQDVARVARLDRDPRDRPEVGGGERARDERPVRAAVRRLVETEAGLAVTARVPLTGADVDRLAGRVVRVDGDRADRVRRDPVRDLLPVRVRRERVGRPPDAAARRADVERALLRLALRVDGERRHAARPLRRLDEGLRPEPVDVKRVRPDEIPLRGQLGAPRSRERVVRRDRVLDLVDRDARPPGTPGRCKPVTPHPRPHPRRSPGRARAWSSGAGSRHGETSRTCLSSPARSTAAAAATTTSPTTAVKPPPTHRIPLLSESSGLSRELYLSSPPGMSRADAPLHADGTIDSVCAT